MNGAAISVVLGTAIAVGAIGAVVLFASRPARRPVCPAGMKPLLDRQVNGASRCCGEGQELVGGHCVGAPTRCPRQMKITPQGCVPERGRIHIPGGRLEIAPAGWETQPSLVPAEVAPFVADSHEVTEADYSRCLEAGACTGVTMTGEPGRAQASVTATEAARYCTWQGGMLPLAEQHALLAMGASGRKYPWGDTGLVCRRAAFGLDDGPCAYGATGPDLAGAHPDGATPEGVQDLAGNVAEWTRANDDPVHGGDGTGQPHDTREHATLVQVRGGSWRDQGAAELSAQSGAWISRDTRSSTIGFRCVYPP